MYRMNALTQAVFEGMAHLFYGWHFPADIAVIDKALSEWN